MFSRLFLFSPFSLWLEHTDLSGIKFHYLGSNFHICVLNFHIFVGLILLGSGHPVMDENGRLPEKFTTLRPVQVSFLLGVFLGFLYFQYFCIQYLLPERFSTQVFFLLHFLRLSSFFLSISFHIFCQVVFLRYPIKSVFPSSLLRKREKKYFVNSCCR